MKALGENLHGLRVLITRPRHQSMEFASKLQALGAEPVLFPVIEIHPIEDSTALDRALLKMSCYDWIIFTSVNGVQAVLERLSLLGIPGLPNDLLCAAIGPKTAAALEMHGRQPDLIPAEYVAEALLPGLGDLRGKWVLLPRADLARPALAQAIREAGGAAHEIAVYRTLPAEPDSQGLEALQSGVDVVTFTSSSTVRSFLYLVHQAGLDPLDLPGHPRFACIGPITAQTAAEEGLPVDLIAGEFTTDGLLEALQSQPLK
jgi:uroporphyrinogen-III synthase